MAITLFIQNSQRNPDLHVRTKGQINSPEKPSSCVAINYREPRDIDFRRLQYQMCKMAGTIYNNKDVRNHTTISNGTNFNKQSNGAAYDRRNYCS
jgi:hypothetical protein